eukprot:6265-Heterococcus_DN1.PRE.1
MVIAWTRMLCAALLSAAHDLRLNAVLMIKEDAAVSTAALQELRQHMDYFKGSSNTIIGCCPTISRLYALGGCSERYAAHEACTEIQNYNCAPILNLIGMSGQSHQVSSNTSTSLASSIAALTKGIISGSSKVLTWCIINMCTRRVKSNGYWALRVCSYVKKSYTGQRTVAPDDTLE